MRVLEIREAPKNFIAKSIRARTLYELFERRNEWTDWHGSTALMSRGGNYADLKDVDTLDALKARAERRSKQGSVFSIRVIPALILENDKHCLVVGERRTQRPFAGLLEHSSLQAIDELKWPSVFLALMSFCLERHQGFVLSMEDRSDVTRFEKFSTIRPCFNFESRPRGKAASLGWVSSGRVSTAELRAFVAAVKRKRTLEKIKRKSF